MRPKFPPNPFREVLGIEIEIPARGRCLAALPAVPAARGPEGDVAQGAVATLCDITMGHAIGAQMDMQDPFATVHMQIAFHREAGDGPLRGEGESPELAHGWKEVMASCRVVREDGTLVATAQGFFARRPPGAQRPSDLPDAGEADRSSLPALLAPRRAGDAMAMTVGGALLNPDAVGHGGAMASALDLAMRDALQREGAGAVALRTFDVRYILPALPGEVRLVPKIDRKGRAIHFARARAEDDQGRTLCAAVGIYGGRMG